MSDKTLNLYWLDDDTSRFEAFKTLLEDSASDFDLTVKVYPIEVDSGISVLILNWEKAPPAPPPDLFMLDHIFVADLPHRLNGNTLAHLLRRTFADIPLVSVTAMYATRSDSSGQDVNEYTALFHYNHLSERVEDLFSIARDYAIVTPSSWEELVKLLGVPDSEKKVLKLAVPQELLREITPTKRNQLVRWIRDDLLSKPGYLFDELHAATFLGLSIAGFRKVQQQFQEALYRGPFRLEKKPLWWQTRLRDSLYKILGQEASDYTQIAGRQLANFEKEDLCKCYVSGTTDAKDFVVAETHPNKNWQVVRECFAKQNPNDVVTSPGFDQPLIIDGQ